MHQLVLDKGLPPPQELVAAQPDPLPPVVVDGRRRLEVHPQHLHHAVRGRAVLGLVEVHFADPALRGVEARAHRC